MEQSRRVTEARELAAAYPITNTTDEAKLFDRAALPPVTLPRPSMIDDRAEALVYLRAAERMLPEFKRWVGSDGSSEPVDDEELLNDLIEMQVGAFGTDGYHLARELEEIGYTPNAECVSQMEQLGFYQHDALDELVKQWVKAADIKLALEVGTKVKATTKHLGKVEVYEGVITRTDAERALYTVTVPSLGHLTEEDVKAHKSGTLGLLLPAECVEPLTVPEPEPVPEPEAIPEAA